MRILEEFGEITLQKFIFIASSRIENLADYDKYYDVNLNGYYIEWPYHYNKNTHETDGIRLFISDGISDSNKAVISNRLVRRN